MTRSQIISFLFASAAIGVACSNGGNASCPNPGGPASGAADTHCVDDAGAAIVQSTSQSSCHPVMPDAGTSDDGGAPTSDYGATLFGASGDDDDCKYHVSWTSTPVCEGSGGVTFTVVATNKTDGSPLTGAAMQAEVFLGVTHPSPTPFVTSTEGPPGTYVTQPAKFDAPGQWTVRFHFFEDCEDTLDDSPHGHAAFYVNVP
jgi:hypothetical protein